MARYVCRKSQTRDGCHRALGPGLIDVTQLAVVTGVQSVCLEPRWYLHAQRWLGPSFREKDTKHAHVSRVCKWGPDGAFTVADFLNLMTMHSSQKGHLPGGQTCLSYWVSLSGPTGHTS